MNPRFNENIMPAKAVEENLIENDYTNNSDYEREKFGKEAAIDLCRKNFHELNFLVEQAELRLNSNEPSIIKSAIEEASKIMDTISTVEGDRNTYINLDRESLILINAKLGEIFSNLEDKGDRFLFSKEIDDMSEYRFNDNRLFGFHMSDEEYADNFMLNNDIYDFMYHINQFSSLDDLYPRLKVFMEQSPNLKYLPYIDHFVVSEKYQSHDGWNMYKPVRIMEGIEPDELREFLFDEVRSIRAEFKMSDKYKIIADFCGVNEQKLDEVSHGVHRQRGPLPYDR